MAKLRVLEYWQNLLRAEVHALSSLSYFKAEFYSLSQPHLVWMTANSNPFECSKSTVLAAMMSGRYRTDYLCRHWTSNTNGYCLASTCHQVVGDLEHLLFVCPSHRDVRKRLYRMWSEKSSQFPVFHQFVTLVLGSTSTVQLQFVLEPKAFPLIVTLFQEIGQPIIDTVYYLIRTYVFYIHRDKQTSLGRWTSSGVVSSKTIPSNNYVNNRPTNCTSFSATTPRCCI